MGLSGAEGRVEVGLTERFRGIFEHARQPYQASLDTLP